MLNKSSPSCRSSQKILPLTSLSFNHVEQPTQLLAAGKSISDEVATQIYFGKELKDITIAETAMLAGLPKAPSAHNPVTNFRSAKIRQEYILQRMRDLGYISSDDYLKAMAEELHICELGNEFLEFLLRENTKNSLPMKYKRVRYKALFASLAAFLLSNNTNFIIKNVNAATYTTCSPSGDGLTAIYCDGVNDTFNLSIPSGTSVSNETAITLTGSGSNVLNVTNSGTITSTKTIGINYFYPGGVLGYSASGSITNSGTIEGTGPSAYAITNQGASVSINNSNTGVIRSVYGTAINNYYGTDTNFNNYGGVSTIVNDGAISSSGGGSGYYGTIYSWGDNSNSVNLTNNSSGVISATGSRASAIVIEQGVANITNYGTIRATGSGSDAHAIYSSWIGTITDITNYGSITSANGYGIYNESGGTITTLNNLQGVGNANGPLTYAGKLPTNYNIRINSFSQYGQLSAGIITGSTTFGVASGSTVNANGKYTSVLSGVGASNLQNTSLTYNSQNGTLVQQAGSLTTWDLCFGLCNVTSDVAPGPSTEDTQQSLVNTASVLQGSFTLQNSVMVNGFTYDCPVFDKHGICVSVGGRNTTVQAQGVNNTGGLLIASYRLDKNNSRIGAWVDRNLSVSAPSAVKLGNSTPMIGLFGVWSQRPDGAGAEVKVSAAYGQKDTSITRQIVGTSEAGTGSSQLISQGAQAVVRYGFAVTPDVVVSPYAGARYTQNNMGGYTEATSSAVTAPLTYSALNTNATTALAGAEARYRGIPKTTLFASAGVETDTNTRNGSYSATGVSSLTSVNFNPNPVKTRPTATAGGYHDIMKNQRIGVTGIYRQEAYRAVSTAAVLVTYTISV